MAGTSEARYASPSFTPMPKGTAWTDGQRYSYSPMHVLLRYKAEQTNPARDYLHSVLHCVFWHMYLHGRVEKEAWSLACDMVVEDLIADLSLRATAVAREEEQQRGDSLFHAFDPFLRGEDTIYF